MAMDFPFVSGRPVGIHLCGQYFLFFKRVAIFSPLLRPLSSLYLYLGGFSLHGVDSRKLLTPKLKGVG